MLYSLKRYAGNPIITIPQDGEARSQYVPHAVQLPNGDVWLAVKGDFSREIRGYLSVDGGRSFVAQGAIIAPTPGAWDSLYCCDPVMIISGETIHYYYKGNTTPGYGGMGIGHATASVYDPSTVTKDPLNPVLTGAAILAAYGARFGLTEVRDLYIADAMRDPWNVPTLWGGFYGQAGTPYRIFRMRTATWSDPGCYQEGIISPAAPYTFVQAPCVYINSSGNYVMLFTEGYDSGVAGALHQTVAWCLPDGNWNWTRTGVEFLPSGVAGAWDSKLAYCAHLLKGGTRSDLPIVIDGTWKLYYSGAPTSPNIATSGLVELEPSEMVTLP